MSQLRVSDAPVARAENPIESYQAGENRAAREASEIAVVGILATRRDTNPKPMTAHDIVCTAELAGMPWTGQRLRTAIAQLNRKGLIIPAGRVENASPTGRAAMTWKLADQHKRRTESVVKLECAWGDCGHDSDCPEWPVVVCDECSNLRADQAEHSDEPAPVVEWDDAEARVHKPGSEAWDWDAPEQKADR